MGQSRVHQLLLDAHIYKRTSIALCILWRQIRKNTHKERDEEDVPCTLKSFCLHCGDGS